MGFMKLSDTFAYMVTGISGHDARILKTGRAHICAVALVLASIVMLALAAVQVPCAVYTGISLLGILVFGRCIGAAAQIESHYRK